MAARRTRLWWMLSIGTILLLAVLFYIQFFLARPVGSGPAGPTVRRDAFEKVWTTQPVKLVGIGDSITAGLGRDRWTTPSSIG